LKSPNFRQQAAAWKHTIKRQSTSWPKRILVWLVIGLALMVSLALMTVVLLLSWLLIPVMIYRARKRMRAAAQNTADTSPYSNVIEGEIVDEAEHHTRR